MSKHKPKYKRIAQLKTAEAFQEYAASVGADLPFTKQPILPGPLAESFPLSSSKSIGNRFCILPMEGWDGTPDGKPTEFTRRRWNHFATSGAKLLWGCEAVAVRHDARANPNQLLLNGANEDEFKRLYESILADHLDRFNETDDLLVGLQLTHSGRFSKPNNTSKAEPKIAWAHPSLNKRFGLPMDYPILSDSELDQIVEDFVVAAERASRAGFQFVDIKHCHGYLGHELLSARGRAGRYGGSFENRTRFLSSIVQGIKETSGIECAVRLSAFDFVAFNKGEDETGVAEKMSASWLPFGCDDTGLGFDLSETFQFLELLQWIGIRMVCVTAGSPYYNPHIQRPALFPPSDGYQPPEDPLAGVARQIKATAEIKKAFPELLIVGSAYSYLQEWLPHVALPAIEQKMTDFIGLGRLVLSYPSLVDDVLNGRPLQRDRICRTFSDCTTAPRNGMISGCFPLDPFYKALPESTKLKEIKKED